MAGATSAETAVATYKLVVEVVSAQVTDNRQGSECIELNFGGQRHRTAVKDNYVNIPNESFYFDVSDPSRLPEKVLKAYVYKVKMRMNRSFQFTGIVRIPGTSFLPLPDARVMHYPLYHQGGTRLFRTGELCLKVYTIGDPSITTANPSPQMDTLAYAGDDSLITSTNTSPQIDSAICSPDRHVSTSLESILQIQSTKPHDIPLKHLKDVTNNFSDERIIGKGGFGVVYKGVLQNGEMIAVKKIVSSLMPGLQKQFESEVYHLMMLKHTNIVRCLGYCYEIRNECLE